jgi:tRNA A-37 threonylcarbamoyl transferase component Bud32
MESYVEFELSGYRWTLKPQFASVIRGKVIPLALSGEDSADVRVVRRKFTRDSFIISVDDATPPIFAKIHKYDKRGERMKTAFRASRAKMEWLRGEEMLRYGLPVPESFGIGERRSGGIVTGCVLFQQALTQCVSLSDYLLGGQPDKGDESYPRLAAAGYPLPDKEVRVELLKSLGRLVRRMHSIGFWHPDLHTSNVLVDAKAAPPELWLVDLHATGRSSHLSRRRRMADLAKLVFSLQGFCEESELYELLAGYKPDAGREQVKEMLSRLLVSTDLLRKRRLKSRSKRCLKTSGKFVVERVGDKKLYRSRDFNADDVLAAVRRHKEICASKGPEFVKATSKSVLTSFQLSSEGGEAIYVKEFANRGAVKLLETIFYVHRGRRAWKAGHVLRLLRIPGVQLIALVEESTFGLLHTSYLLMKEVPDAVRLNVFLLRNYFRVSGRLNSEEISKKRYLVRAGAIALREFHKKNVYHNDMSGKNLLVTLDNNGEPQFLCVDLDSIQFPRRLSLRRRIKNIAQLNGLPSCITTTDRIRFYKEYFGVQTLTAMHKLLISIIWLISRRRVRRSRRVEQMLHRQKSQGAEIYEDIASL